MERLQCLRKGFLYKILSFGTIPYQPHCQTKKAGEVWQGLCLKRLPPSAAGLLRTFENHAFFWDWEVKIE
jgi:hypothetical protein